MKVTFVLVGLSCLMRQIGLMMVFLLKDSGMRIKWESEVKAVPTAFLHCKGTISSSVINKYLLRRYFEIV